MVLRLFNNSKLSPLIRMLMKRVGSPDLQYSEELDSKSRRLVHHFSPREEQFIISSRRSIDTIASKKQPQY